MGGRPHRARDFLSRVYHKAAEDKAFFLASSISFNVVVAIIPLLLLMVGIWGFVVSARYGEPDEVIVPMMLSWMPAIGGDIDLVAEVGDAIAGLVDSRAGFSVVGALLFVWLSTRLVGTLRIALREVFDIALDRGFIAGKIIDVQIVVLGGALVLVNLGITLVLRAVGRRGAELLGLRDTLLGPTQQVLGPVLAFLSIWILFVLIYWYVPARRVLWRTAVIAGTVMSVYYEVMKLAFSWYAISLANYGSTYGNLTTLFVLLFWIYYGSVVFVLSGEIAQVYTMRKARRMQIQSAQAAGS